MGGRIRASASKLPVRRRRGHDQAQPLFVRTAHAAFYSPGAGHAMRGLLEATPARQRRVPKRRRGPGRAGGVPVPSRTLLDRRPRTETGPLLGPGELVKLLIDDGRWFFDLRGLWVRRRTAPADQPPDGASASLVWLELRPDKVVAWDYGRLRQAAVRGEPRAAGVVGAARRGQVLPAAR